MALKEQNNSLKKKMKRQEEELGNNKTDLQKLTNMAEERLNEYVKEDQEKQMAGFIEDARHELDKQYDAKSKFKAAMSKILETL